jgi:hypothetical protein
MRFVSLLLAWCLFITPAMAESVAGDSPQIAYGGFKKVVPGKLTPGAREAGELIGCLAMVERVIAAQESGQKGPAAAKRLAMMKMMIYKRMWSGVLDVRHATDRIDKELANSYDVRDGLIAKRNALVSYTNIGNFMQGGTLGSTRTGILMDSVLPPHYNQASNYIRIVTSSLGISLSALSLFLSKTGSRKIDDDPNSLSGFFSVPSTQKYYLSGMVWKFINRIPPDHPGTETRRERLVRQWERMGRLKSKKQHMIHKLASAPQSEKEKNERIGLITDRIFMLHDVHALIEELDENFLELHKAISSSSPPAAFHYSDPKVGLVPVRKPTVASMQKVDSIQKTGNEE